MQYAPSPTSPPPPTTTTIPLTPSPNPPAFPTPIGDVPICPLEDPQKWLLMYIVKGMEVNVTLNYVVESDLMVVNYSDVAYFLLFLDSHLTVK